MSVVLALGVIAASAAFVIALMLVLRARFAPRGGHFVVSDRASGVFGFFGAGFAILLGFVVLVSFQRYADAKDHAADEASAVFEEYQSAPQRVRGELVCYGRAVVALEWPAMEHGGGSDAVDGWAERIDMQAPGAQAAARNDARRLRLIEAQGSLPALLWVMLILAAVAVLVFVLLYADPAERAFGQSVIAGGATALIVSSLLAVALLASPFGGGHGRVGPQAMRYTVQLLAGESAGMTQPPCDARGNPV